MNGIMRAALLLVCVNLSLSRKLSCGFLLPHVTNNHRTFRQGLSIAPLPKPQKRQLHSSKEGDSPEEGKDGDDFWMLQKALMAEMTSTVDKKLKEEQVEKFAKRRMALVSDTTYFTIVIFAILWGLCASPFTPLSYVFGSLFGLAYSYGLGKYVESLGENPDTVKGAGVGQARFAFLVLLFILVGKFRSFGLEAIPAIMGFFTYQIAALNQGLRERND